MRCLVPPSHVRPVATKASLPARSKTLDCNGTVTISPPKNPAFERFFTIIAAMQQNVELLAAQGRGHFSCTAANQAELGGCRRNKKRPAAGPPGVFGSFLGGA